MLNVMLNVAEMHVFPASLLISNEGLFDSSTGRSKSRKERRIAYKYKILGWLTKIGNKTIKRKTK